MFNELETANISKLLSFLNQPVESAVGLSRKQLQKIAQNIGGRVFNFLIENLPEKYETRLLANSKSDFLPDEIVTFKARVMAWRRSFKKLPAILKLDFKGSIVTIAFFGKIGDIYATTFREGDEILVSGSVKANSFTPTLVNPDIFKFDEEWKALLSGYVPIYKKIAGVSHLFMLRTAKFLLDEFAKFSGDWLPSEIAGQFDFPAFIESVANIHFPRADANFNDLNSFTTPWHKKLAFDKLLLFQFGAYNSRFGENLLKNRVVKVNSKLSSEAEKALPFVLTDAQKRVLSEIRGDLASPQPMNRLLQGDVGSGKTAVMILAALDVVASGFKAVIMAPTEILAVQHFNTISNLLSEKIKIELFVGGVVGKKKRAKRLENAENADFLIGTHALFENLEFMKDIGLIIIDEQHRFGVSQRMKLQDKSIFPDVLIVSATPIPRSLALTVYGSTEISAIDQAPPGRVGITTKFVPSQNRSKVFDFIIEIVKNRNKKGYWVCPLVEESEKMDLQHVEGVFKEFFDRLGDKVLLLHGKMKGEEKSKIVEKLKTGEVNLLVSTVVVEVGVDIGDAVFMVIENAERFGLAQLHQLRGRIGRGAQKSFCALIAGSEISKKAEKRLEFISKTANGFKIAEYDLKMRGPGALTGLEQSGFKNDPYFLLSVRHAELVERARTLAKSIFTGGNDELKNYFLKVFNLFFLESFNKFKTG